MAAKKLKRLYDEEELAKKRLELYFDLRLWVLALVLGFVSSTFGAGLWDINDLWPIPGIDLLLFRRILFIISAVIIIGFLLYVIPAMRKVIPEGYAESEYIKKRKYARKKG